MKIIASITLLISIILISFSCSKEKRSDRKGPKMQEFIIEISNFARKQNPNFIVIPQNGIELAFNDLAEEDGLNQELINAIDGFGIEELFYNTTVISNNEILGMVQKVNEVKTIMVADFAGSNANYNDAIQQCQNNGFICFPRKEGNYDYIDIPSTLINENTDNITKLSDAKNYLYLISDSEFSSKTAYLDALRATNYDVLLIDAFYEGEQLTLAEVNSLKVKDNGGSRLVIAYMNIGAAEKYRYYWKDKWKVHSPGWLKKKYDGYDDEIWVKYWKKEWKEIIYSDSNSYTQRILNSGFNGVYLDNVEAYYFLYFD
ncbi:MAG TPA: endo alpha-1,4 polygalactosaminidase [Brumimicrobium sp.]|nr:endo alpha-1,4 polygalactosaminidase [Brumimicrobium sp.]